MRTVEIRPMWLINIKRPFKPADARVVFVINAEISVYCKDKHRIFIYGNSSFGTKEAADRERRVRMVAFISDWWNFKNRREDFSRCHDQLVLEFNYKYDLYGNKIK